MRKSTENPTLEFTSWTGTGPFLSRPMTVVLNPAMTVDAKRALLASWASDARTVADRPALRHLDDGSLARIDDITRALKELDVVPASSSLTDLRRRPTRRRGARSKMAWLWRRRDNDDDDPPTPAPAGICPRPPILEGSLAAAA